MKFEVDTNGNWSPFSLQPLPGGSFGKKFSDHLGIKTVIKCPKILEKKMKKREIINYKNEEGWKIYEEQTNEIADTIRKITENEDLSIDEVREMIRA